jgi:ParB family transcriptional regulator, chromosome partitioning protein
MAKRVLGKGLEAIITSSGSTYENYEGEIAVDEGRIIELDIGKIKPNPDQPRTHFSDEEISNLAESIKTSGLLQPIIVRKLGDEYFVVAGERRLRASKYAGLKKIKSIIIQANEEENLTFALIENIQRSDLDPIEEAKAYRVLINRFKLKQQDIASKVGKDRATISNIIRLLNLPEEIQNGISDGKISSGHAKALLTIPEKRQMNVYRDIIDKGLSVRAVEKLSEAAEEEKTERSQIKKDPHIKKMEEALISTLGTKVEIKHQGSKGSIEIFYYSLDDFDRIVDLIK